MISLTSTDTRCSFRFNKTGSQLHILDNDILSIYDIHQLSPIQIPNHFYNFGRILFYEVNYQNNYLALVLQKTAFHMNFSLLLCFNLNKNILICTKIIEDTPINILINDDIIALIFLHHLDIFSYEGNLLIKLVTDSTLSGTNCTISNSLSNNSPSSSPCYVILPTGCNNNRIFNIEFSTKSMNNQNNPSIVEITQFNQRHYSAPSFINRITKHINSNEPEKPIKQVLFSSRTMFLILLYQSVCQYPLKHLPSNYYSFILVYKR